jgi:hypothetical protein
MTQGRRAMVQVEIGRQSFGDNAVVIAQELLQATAPVGQMLNMAVDLDAVTGGENNPLAPFGILGKLFEWAFKGVRGKMQPLPPFDWGRFMVQTDDNDMHRCSAIFLRGVAA